MTADGEPKSLSEITKDMGLNMSDVAAFSGLDESTIFRLWDNAEWLDRVSGRSLQSLMSSVPGIAEYSMAHAVRKRRDVLIGDLNGEGLTVDVAALEKSDVAQQHLLNALEAALHIIRGEATQKTSSFIARFWGREQDRALEALYNPEPGSGLLSDPQTLFDSSIDLAPRLNRKSYSFHSILALNILTHQVSKVTGELEADLGFEVPGRQAAFMMRGVVMGSLIGSNDIELAERYRRELDATPVYAALEEWSFPTYTRDGRISSDFTLPSSLSLRNTATEVLREIAEYNDAYVYYLVSTYIPLALKRDPAFGGKIAELIQAVELRGAECRDKRIRQTCNTLVRRLKGAA
ncbi:hypothetical protein [Actinomadura livida]|uniref:Uncharacterized protein n=1 Tax=Actinomadura livida TaxID=79909 RepID=A0A7W7IHY4_9ACTN|nr:MULTISPECIES: hypothetical protein [Actinomadura]MBB4777295.1 hypothetical protein [Actinomadura catellatispora]GGU20276.1 hypothetical protein GCM10010208_51510 [Actinomadura livida]